jgi:hypothetical protein
MSDIDFACPKCGQKLSVDEAGVGMTFPCPTCNQSIIVPSSEILPPMTLPVVAPIAPQPPQYTGAPIERLADSVENQFSEVVRKLANDQQDPALVQKIYSKVKDILTKNEEIVYIAIQNTPIVNIAPDAFVLTNRRFVLYQPKVLGRLDFEDFIWRDLTDVKLKEGIFGATITMQTVKGRVLKLEYIPKPQARKLYARAQEMEERVLEERRIREMDEKRAAAGGVVIQSPMPTAQSAVAGGSDDPITRLQKLKQMLDSGLITSGEYESKRASIVSQM